MKICADKLEMFPSKIREMKFLAIRLRLRQDKLKISKLYITTSNYFLFDGKICAIYWYS